MKCERELKLLCDTLKRCFVFASPISPTVPLNQMIDSPFLQLLSRTNEKKETIQSLVGMLSEKTMYKYTDIFRLCYLFLPLDLSSSPSVLLVGPYLPEPLSSRDFLELGERLGVPPKSQRYFERLYENIPILSEGNPAFVMLDTFCEQLWETASFSICNVNLMEREIRPNLPEDAPGGHFDEEWMNIKAMEIRYRFENELMEAVSKGQIQKEKMLSGLFSNKIFSISDKFFEKRVSDPLRNAKNYGIIMNTLLRKAAERGGVHPVHIDKMSSEFATKIENMTSHWQNADLMREMFCSYCNLVRRNAVQNFSPIIQTAVLLIESDLSADLSTGALAKQQNISPAYFSVLFKKETGKTVSEYIREKRIQYASDLLCKTHLQIQTVAQHCGVMDVQYFSKLFKRQTGKTPKEYRAMFRT